MPDFNLGTIGVVVIVVLLLFLLGKLIKAPFKIAFKLLINTIGGFAGLVILNFLGAFIGVSLGVNWINAAVVGVLGIPGVALLLILQWLMVI